MRPSPALFAKKLYQIEEWSREEESQQMSEYQSNSINLRTPIKTSQKRLDCFPTASSSIKKARSRRNKYSQNELNLQICQVKIQNVKIQESSLRAPFTNEAQNGEDNLMRSKIQLLESIDSNIVSYYQVMESSQCIDTLLVKYGQDPVLASIHRELSTNNKIQVSKTKFKRSNEIQKETKLKIQQYDKTPYDILQQNLDVKPESATFTLDKNLKNNRESLNYDEYNLKKFVKEYHNQIGTYERLPVTIEQCFKSLSSHQIKFDKSDIDIIKNQNYNANFRNEQNSCLQNKQSETIFNPSATTYNKIFEIKERIFYLKSCMNRAVIKELNEQYKRKNKKIVKKDTFRRQNRKIKGKRISNSDVYVKMEDTNNQSDMCEEDCHICRICWYYFDNGHQLGGHMAKKHPGHSLIYRNKRIIKQNSSLERKRKNYLKAIKDSTVENYHPQESQKSKGKQKCSKIKRDLNKKVQQVTVVKKQVKLQSYQ